MKFINYTVVKFSIFLTLGILSAYYFRFTSSIIFLIAIGSLALLFVSWLTSKRHFNLLFSSELATIAAFSA